MRAYPTVLRRDRLACWLCAWVLHHVASRQYQAFVWGCSRAGIEHLPAWMDEQDARQRAQAAAKTAVIG